MNGSIGNLDETHELAPINNDRVPFRYILGIKKLDNEVVPDELLYMMITKGAETLANPEKWPEGTLLNNVPLKTKDLKWLAHDTIIKGCETFEDGIETLVKLKYINKNGSWHRIVNHPWK